MTNLLAARGRTDNEKDICCISDNYMRNDGSLRMLI